MPRIILALLICLVSQQVLNADAIDRAWQTSIEPVTLSLRNKLADAPYTVQFIVEAQSSDAQWSYTTESAANDWQRPQFPQDFNGPNVDHLRPQAYTWHARVVGDGNQRVMHGSFTYPNGESGRRANSAQLPQVPGQLIVDFDTLFAERYAISMLVYPEQIQGGPFLSCTAYVRITDAHSGASAAFHSRQFSLPEAALRPYIETVREPDDAERILPGVHSVVLSTGDYLYKLSDSGNQTLSFDRGFAFADFDHDGQLELLVARFMDGQRMRCAYSVYALDFASRFECPVLEPIQDTVLCQLDSTSTLNLATQMITNHSSGSAYDSVYQTYQLHSLQPTTGQTSFSKRSRYLLTVEEGATTKNVPSGHYQEMKHHYRYTLAADGTWQQQVISKHKQIKAIN